VTALFDGMAGVLNDVFGASVTIYPSGGLGTKIQGVIRDREVEVADEDGEPVLATMTTLRALRADVLTLGAGDMIVAAIGSHRVLYRVPPESPADDRFETFVLEAC